MASFLDSLSPNQTAIVLIEFQNDFTTAGGVLNGAVAPCMASNNMLTKTQELVTAARAKGIKIVHAPITFSDDYREISPAPFGILANVKAGRAFLASGHGGAIIDCLAPSEAEGDIVIQGKRGLCAFASTNLDFILRHNGITTVAFAGFLTNCCVESSVRTAYERGFKVITLSDCCAATSIEEHEAALKFTLPMFSIPITKDEFVAKLN